MAPPRLPRLNEIALDRVAFFFGVGVSLVTGAACGLVPAPRGSAIDLSTALKDEGTTTMGRSRRWFSNAMVVVETALALRFCGHHQPVARREDLAGSGPDRPANHE